MKRWLMGAKILQPLSVNENPPFHATLTIPGLGLDAYDWEGQPKITSLMHQAAVSRLYALNFPYSDFGDSFLDWVELTSENFMFASASRLVVSKSLYNPSVPKDAFECKTALGVVGNCSIGLVTDAFVPGETHHLFQQINQLVCVDMTTRRPKPLPDWFKDRYTGNGLADGSVRVTPLDKPANTFVYDVKVAWSDTDYYKHTNYASYVRFAVDAIHAALKEQEEQKDSGSSESSSSTAAIPDQASLKGLTREILANGVKSMEVCYLKESKQGQRLDLHLWQDEDCPHKVRCVIESHGQDICHLTLEYFDKVQSFL